jgi:hypothetical protein
MENTARKLEESILAHCRTLPGTVGMRNLHNGKKAVCQLGVIGAEILHQADTWEEIAGILGVDCPEIEAEQASEVAAVAAVPDAIEVPNATALGACFKAVLFCASRDATRPNLSQVLVKVERPGWLTIVATDGHRLAMAELSAPGITAAAVGLQWLPTRDQAKALAGIKGDFSAGLMVDGSVKILGGAMLPMRSESEEKFPPYKKVIPSYPSEAAERGKAGRFGVGDLPNNASGVFTANAGYIVDAYRAVNGLFVALKGGKNRACETITKGDLDPIKVTATVDGDRGLATLTIVTMPCQR